jgi:hypothetical protein
MARCGMIASTPEKACSGKCKVSVCRSAPQLWVIAAYQGMIALFRKDTDSLTLLPYHGQAVFSSLDTFQKTMLTGENSHIFDQLVIVGSSGDIAWVHACLQRNDMHHIVAEIHCSLLPEWFKHTPALPELTDALTRAFAA